MAVSTFLWFSKLLATAILCAVFWRANIYTMTQIKKFLKNYFLTSSRAENPSAEKKAPEYLKGLQDQEVTEGSEVHFRCKLNGYPQPRVTWYKDGKKLKNSDKYRMGKSHFFGGIIVS